MEQQATDAYFKDVTRLKRGTTASGKVKKMRGEKLSILHFTRGGNDEKDTDQLPAAFFPKPVLNRNGSRTFKRQIEEITLKAIPTLKANTYLQSYNSSTPKFWPFHEQA